MTRAELLDQIMELSMAAHDIDQRRIGNALLNIVRVANLPKLETIREIALAGDSIVNAVTL